MGRSFLIRNDGLRFLLSGPRPATAVRTLLVAPEHGRLALRQAMRYAKFMSGGPEDIDTPPKMDVAQALLLRGSVFVHLDPRVEGVVVPPWLRKQPQLILQVGLDMAVPIVDLRVDERGVFGTLSFNRSPFPCTLPWEAVYAMQGDDGRMMLWPESLPKELRAEVERELGRASRPGLSLVDSEEEAEAETVPSDTEEADRRSFADEETRRLRPAPTSEPARSTKPELVAVPGTAVEQPNASEPTDAPKPDAAEPSKGKRSLPPYLRVVK